MTSLAPGVFLLLAFFLIASVGVDSVTEPSNEALSKENSEEPFLLNASNSGEEIRTLVRVSEIQASHTCFLSRIFFLELFEVGFEFQSIRFPTIVRGWRCGSRWRKMRVQTKNVS